MFTTLIQDEERIGRDLRRQYPYILSSFAIVTAQRTRLHFASSEGSHVVVPSATIRVVVEAATKAADGMDLMRVETFQAESLEPGRHMC